MDTLYNSYLSSSGVSIDSRTIQKGQLYIALNGTFHDGHDFIEDAFDKGASACVVHESYITDDTRCTHVNDTLKALQNLAKHHREQCKKTAVVAVTGSNGKTTTKELLNAVFSSHYKTIATHGNQNNHIGVPLTILAINQHTDVAIIEMGANNPGEHTFLCDIAQPTHAVVLNSGKDHLEGFGSDIGVLSSHLETCKYIHNNRGKLYINQNDAPLYQQTRNMDPFTFAVDDAHNTQAVFYANVSRVYPNISVRINRRDHPDQPLNIHSNLYGRCHATNITAAVTLGLEFNIPVVTITKAISTYKATNNRSQHLKWGSNLVILDAYNANPSSVIPMIRDLANDPRFIKKCLILGEMAELGIHSENEHSNVLDIATRLKINEIICIGHAYSGLSGKYPIVYVSDLDECRKYLKSNVYTNTLVLVKGSRKNTLEKLFQDENRFSNTNSAMLTKT
ncbi:UDP-N-acetylmuramoyl-tripeptide--D-alanyl-D-alanine ligase [Chlamydiia bacterium]|nr:UDP-N-acetylmuramoyl-tripeptide--D-alanyl-D-alanine ligase [Chlamydiia bacterium]